MRGFKDRAQGPNRQDCRRQASITALAMPQKMLAVTCALSNVPYILQEKPWGNSMQKVSESEAMARVRFALVELTANSLRVLRGAGKSSELGEQACEFLRAMNAYEEVAGFYPDSWSLDNALSIQDNPSVRLSVDEQIERQAETTIIRGALQIVASQLLGQSTFESKGQNELYEGIRQLNEHRKELRKRLKEESQKTVPGKNQW